MRTYSTPTAWYMKTATLPYGEYNVAAKGYAADIRNDGQLTSYYPISPGIPIWDLGDGNEVILQRLLYSPPGDFTHIVFRLVNGRIPPRLPFSAITLNGNITFSNFKRNTNLKGLASALPGNPLRIQYNIATELNITFSIPPTRYMEVPIVNPF